MIKKPLVIHLIDDATAGGVTRVVNFLTSSDRLAETAQHRIHHIKRGRMRGIPKDADIIVSHTVISWRTLPALISLRAARPSVPIVHVEHSYTAGFVAHNVKRNARFETLLRTAFALVDFVVPVSYSQAHWIRSRELCHPDHLITIPSCVDLDPFFAMDRPEGRIKTLGAIGRLDRQKGFDTLIEAFRTCSDPDLRLKIIGQGPEEDTLRWLAEGDERICFEGFVSDPTRAFSQVDAVVMPSRWEALGLVAMEAVAAGRPLLCSRIDGLCDHGKFGAIYSDGATAPELARSLARFTSANHGVLVRDNSDRLKRVQAGVIGRWREFIDALAKRSSQPASGRRFVRRRSAPLAAKVVPK